MYLSIPFVVIRIALVVLLGTPIYFSGDLPTCDTLQTGCDQVCFNEPLSPLQFWMFQIILIITPMISFMAPAKWKERKNSQEHMPITSKGPNTDAVDEAENDKEVVEKPNKKQDGLMKVYVFQLLSRAIVEASFLFGQCLLYGVEVKGSFQCSYEPCPHTVNCYLTNAKAKTIFLLSMYAVNGLCLIFTVLEILPLGLREIRQLRCCNPAPQNIDLVYQNNQAETCRKKNLQKRATCEKSEAL